MKQHIELQIGILAPTLEEQLKNFIIEKEKITAWQNILDFLFSNYIKKKLTEKQMDKLVYSLMDEIENYINKGKQK